MLSFVSEVASDIVIWAVLIVALLVVEAMTTGLVSIWFAGGAVVALLLACFGAPVWAEIAAFIIVSIILLVLTRPIAKTYFNDKRVSTNAQSLIGKTAVVKESIDNLAGKGLVTVNGVDWTARSDSDEVIIAEGEAVEVLRIEGVKLIVKEVSRS